MIRGTTPTIIFKLKDIEVSSLYNFYLTFTQNGKVLFEKSKGDSGISIDETNNSINPIGSIVILEIILFLLI